MNEIEQDELTYKIRRKYEAITKCILNHPVHPDHPVSSYLS